LADFDVYRHHCVLITPNANHNPISNPNPNPKHYTVIILPSFR